MRKVDLTANMNTDLHIGNEGVSTNVDTSSSLYDHNIVNSMNRRLYTLRATPSSSIPAQP